MKTEKLTVRPATEKEMNIPSSLVGFLITTFQFLIDAFGDSNGGDDDKTDAEWNLKFSDGSYITIYNYKDGKSYNGEDGMDVEDITKWHIGSDKDVSPDVVKTLEKATKGKYSIYRL